MNNALLYSLLLLSYFRLLVLFLFCFVFFFLFSCFVFLLFVFRLRGTFVLSQDVFGIFLSRC